MGMGGHCGDQGWENWDKLGPDSFGFKHLLLIFQQTSAGAEEAGPKSRSKKKGAIFENCSASA